MHWDVVEVKPEPGYRLFVRFKDGLAGRVQLRQEELTGALAPLLDTQFFEQVFIDCGAVAWPGEIDLAPDAMYAQVANQSRTHVEVHQAKDVVDRTLFRSQLRRFYELKDILADRCHPAPYFRNLEDHLEDPTCFATFAIWEKDLQSVDHIAWEYLKNKAARYLNRDAKDRAWQQLFDVLSEARLIDTWWSTRVARSCVSFLSPTNKQPILRVCVITSECCAK